MCVYLSFDDDEDPCNRKITVSNNVTYNIPSENYTTYATEEAPNFLHRDIVEIYLSHECSLKIIPEIEIVLISHLRNTTRHIISNNQNQCSSINWLQEFMNHQKFLKTNGYQTLSKIYEFLVSNYFFLLILTFSSSPKSVIVVAIIFINSSRITFGLKYHILF